MRDAVLGILGIVLVPLCCWSWSLASRLTALETTQQFIIKQESNNEQLVDVIQKIDKRLTILETIVIESRQLKLNK